MEEEKDGYTQDGTVDLRGNPILRSKRGGWTACSFIVVYEVFERMAYYGISSNLFIYLTHKLHEGTVKSANNVTYWAGTVWMTPILGAYVADALLGRYWTFLIACAIYLSGMALLTLAVSVHPLKPSHCSDPTGATCPKATTLQLAVFFGALYTLTVGTGGTKPNISTMGADQFDEFDPKEKVHKLSFFNDIDNYSGVFYIEERMRRTLLLSFLTLFYFNFSLPLQMNIQALFIDSQKTLE